MSYDELDEDDDTMQCHVCLKPYICDDAGYSEHVDERLDLDHAPRS